MSFVWNEFININSRIEEVKQLINNELSTSPGFIKEPLLEMVASNAKYLRSGFMFLASSFGRVNDHERLLKFAAVIEMFHLATLIHDDVIDDASVRRNNPALHVKYGKRTAILAGDYLFLKCYSIISKYVDFPLVEKLSKLGLRICTSEIEQSGELFSQKTSILKYLKRITGKTASLFAFSFYLGATEAGCSKEVVNTLAKIGNSAGVCFQIIDDILDFTKTTEEIGKSVLTDIKDGVYTLPVIIALKKNPSRLKTLLEEKKFSEDGIKEIIDIIIKNNGISESVKMAEKYTSRSLNLIKSLPDIEAREILLKAVRALLKREF